VLSAELDFVTGLETDLKLVKGFREPLDRAHELSRRVAELRIEAFHGPARPEEIEAWRKSLDTSIQTAVAKTLGIFSEINFKPAEGLRLLNPTN
jgi:SPX domain protein involved in polyphosphate accumulation